MSVNCSLIEVPQDILTLLKSSRETRVLYYRAYNTREEQNISNISKLSKEQRNIVQEIYEAYPNACQTIKQKWNIDNYKSILRYKSNCFEKYIQCKEHLPKIIEYGKICHDLYLGRNWHLIHFLFGGNASSKIPSLVIWDREIIGINILFYKKHILEFGMPDVYYLTINEVKTLAELIEDFGDEIINENLKRVKDEQQSLYWGYRHAIKDESWVLSAKNWCNAIKDFYTKVSARNNCVMIEFN